MYMEEIGTDERVTYLIKPIISVLEEAGGQLMKSEIRNRICEKDERIAEFEERIYTSKKTGNRYRKFDFSFNFAIKELGYTGFINYEKNNPLITLTEKGNSVDLNHFDVVKQVREKAREYWDSFKQKKVDSSTDDNDDESTTLTDNHVLDDFKVSLQEAISNMSPSKFERFSRAQLNKMGAKFTEKGTKVSNDGGIDGYGYHMDENDFRTTRVVIQCKRYNEKPVSEPEINQFLGAMNKYQADYGVFITNGRFTQAAKNAAMEG